MAKQKNEDVFTEIDEIACTYYLIKQNFCQLSHTNLFGTAKKNVSKCKLSIIGYIGVANRANIFDDK